MRTKQNRPGKEIVRLLKEGMRPHDIKNKLNITGRSIRYWAIKLGMKSFPRGRPFRGDGPRNANFKTDLRKVAKKMRLAGSTFRAIGKALGGVTKQRAHQYFLEADS